MLILIFLLLGQSMSEPRVSFCAVGDIMLDRGVKRIIKKNSIDYPLVKLHDNLTKFDLAFCNLECPISARGNSSKKEFCFRGDTSFFQPLLKAGFSIFSLANNHTIDWGKDAFLDTKEIIEENDRYAIGAGRNQQEARAPRIFMKNGLTFAFLAYLGEPFERLIGSNKKPGPAQARLEEIVAEIIKVRNTVDFIVLSLHWGLEYKSEPTKGQVKWAHRLIDAGADLIIGHHPHVLQSIGIYKDRYILYSLGNFVFDQRKLYQRQSGIFSCIFRKGSIDSAMFLPVLLTDFQPNCAEGKDFELIEEKIKKISKGYNTKFNRTDNAIFITDSNKMQQFNLPIKYGQIGKLKIVINKQLIELIDTNGTTIDTLGISCDRELKECVCIEDSNHFFVLGRIGRPGGSTDDRLALYQIKENRITLLKPGIEQPIQPWKIITADLEDDSIVDICIGALVINPLTSQRTSKLFVYNLRDRQFWLKWSGANFAPAFSDFKFLDIDRDGTAELITLEPADATNKNIVAYQWCGFGFFTYKILAQEVQDNWLPDLNKFTF